jgi:hypothetical protein
MSLQRYTMYSRNYTYFVIYGSDRMTSALTYRTDIDSCSTTEAGNEQYADYSPAGYPLTRRFASSSHVCYLIV